MERLFAIIVFFVLYASTSMAQVTYKSLIKEAEQAYDSKDYKKSLKSYKSAFKITEGIDSDYYNAACVASLANKKRKATKLMKSALENGWKKVEWMEKDEDLTNLRNHKSWDLLMATAKKNKDQSIAHLNKPLLQELLIMRDIDQDYRHKLSNATFTYGWDHPVTEAMSDSVQMVDLKNTARMMELVEEGGFPKISDVGRNGSHAAWLLVQHADHKPGFQQKCLDLIRPLVDAREISSEDYVFLFDRVRINSKQKQLYGTQIGPVMTSKGESERTFIYIEEPASLNDRRKAFGLSSIEDYASSLDITYVSPTEAEAKKNHLALTKVYENLVDSALYFLNDLKFEESLATYKKVMQMNGYVNELDYYNAARALASLDISRVEEIFEFLGVSRSLGFYNEEQLFKQEEFIPLYETDQWGDFMDAF